MRTAGIALLAALTCGLAGCGQETRVGTAVGSPEARTWWGGYAPVIPVRGPDGRATTLNHAAGPLFILAFVRPGAECAAIDPRVRQLADELRTEGVNVAQVALPSERCPQPPEDLAAARPEGWNLYLFFDPERIVWRAFGSPAPGTLLLIDDFRYVVTTGTLADTGWIVFRAEDKARDLERRQRELFSGGRRGGGCH